VTAAGPKIIHLASGREWRGGQRQVLLLARELARLGADQLLITRAAGRLAREAVAAGVPVHGVAWRSGLSLAALRAAWWAARRRPALLHAHDAHAVAVAALAALLARRPFVATKRTDFPIRRPAAWRRAARTIAISAAVRDRLVEAGIDPARIALVPSGIDVEATRAVRPGAILHHLGLPEDRPLAVNVAAFTREKDHETLLRAAALVARQAPSLHWAIAGDGPLRTHLEKLAGDLGVAERIHFTGWLDDPLPLVAAARLFVLSSTAEGMGTVLLDAMALGVPVVATRAGGIPETVADGALLVPPGSVEELAAAVVQVVGDQSLRARLREAGTARVSQATAAGMAHAVGQVYRSIESGVGTRRP
jgi:glycosyltransferase involved in cell wall biosynthesis